MYSAQDIQCMKRTELQALCKTNKLKANGKTEILVEMLLDHFSLASSSAQTASLPAKTAVRKPLHAPGSKKTKAPNTIKKKSLPVASTFLPTPQRPSGGAAAAAADDDDDEMRLQTPVAIRAKKVSAHNSLLKRALESSFTPAPATRPRAAIQAQPSFSTSPATKKIINVLLATVDTLKAELATTRSSLTRLESTTNIVSAPSTPPLKRAEVLALVNERIVQHRAQVDASIEQRFASVSAHLAELSKAVELATTREERESIIQLRDTLDEEVRSNRVWRRELEGSFETLRSNLTGHVGGTTAPKSSISSARAPSAPAQNPAFASPTLSNSLPPSSPASSMKPDTPSAASENAAASAPVSPAILGLASTPAPNPASPAMSDGAPPTTTLASFSSPSASPRRTPRSRNSHKPSPLNIAPTTVTSEGIEPALALPLHMLSHVSPSKNKTISPRRGASSPQASPQRSLASASTPATVVAMSPARSIVRSIGKRPRRESDIGDVSVDGMEVPGRASPSRAMGNSEARGIKGLSGGRARKRMRISPGAESQMEQAPEAAAEYASESEEEEEEEEEEAVQAVLTSDPRTFGDEELLSEEEGEEAVYHQAEETTPPTLLNTPREFFVSTKLGDDSFVQPATPSSSRNPCRLDGAPSLFVSPTTTRQVPLDPSPATKMTSPFRVKSPARSHIARSLHGTPRRTPIIPSAARVFADASNRHVSSVAVPPTPLASKTLYGTERFGDEEDEMRFGDVVVSPGGGMSSPVITVNPFGNGSGASGKTFEWTGYGLFGET